MVAKMNFLKLFSKSTIFQKLKDLFLSDRKGNYKEVIDDLIESEEGTFTDQLPEAAVINETND